MKPGIGSQSLWASQGSARLRCPHLYHDSVKDWFSGKDVQNLAESFGFVTFCYHTLSSIRNSRSVR